MGLTRVRMDGLEWFRLQFILTLKRKGNRMEKLQQITKQIELYRGLILDSVEAEMGGTPSWKYVRSRLLKYLGESGLQGKIEAILSESSTRGGNGNE
jgi:hypothetical protein